MPAGAFGLLAALLLIADTFTAWVLVESLPGLQPVGPLVGILLDLGIVIPVLMFLFVLPTARSIRRSERTERALKIAHEELENRVRQRTLDLETANAQLVDEADRARTAQRAVEFQAGLLDAVQEAVAATDTQGRIRYWNHFAEELYGWTAGDVAGRPVHEVFTYLDQDGRRLDMTGQCTAGVSWAGEVEAVRRDGSRFPAYVVSSSLPDETGGHVCISLNTTASKAAEQAIRTSEQRYSSVVENAPTGIFIMQNSRLAFVNPQLARWLGYSREELIEIEAWRLAHPDDRDRVRQMVSQREVASRASPNYECRLVTKAGEVLWVTVQHTFIPFRSGKAVLGNVQDVTESRRMKRELRQLSARLLRVQEEERQKIARDLHDGLGQTLTGIKFKVEAALGENRAQERREGMKQLRALVPTIQDAVEEVRRIATELRPSILDDLGLLPTIAWYVRECEKAHPCLTVEQEIALKGSSIPRRLSVPIYRILQEATNNVVKHSGASHLVIGLEVQGDRVGLRVSDDGVGFDSIGCGAGGGCAGFGLSSMRERSELTGGRFSVSSAPGQGTTIHVDWPIDPVLSA